MKEMEKIDLPPFRRTLLVRVGWTDYYGLNGYEIPLAGGKFNLENTGSEIWNFAPYSDGKLRGYAQMRGLAAARLDPEGSDGGRFDDYLVVFFARDPQRGGQRIVGWYRSAEILLGTGEPPKLPVRPPIPEHYWRPARPSLQDDFAELGDRGIYNIVSSVEKAVLLYPEMREHRIPRGRGYPGQSNVYYAINEDGAERRSDWLIAIRSKIESWNGPNALLEGPRTLSARMAVVAPRRSFDADLSYSAVRTTTELQASIERQDSAAMPSGRAPVFIATASLRKTLGQSSMDLAELIDRIGELELSRVSSLSFALSLPFLQRLERELGRSNIRFRVLLWPPGGASRQVAEYLCEKSTSEGDLEARELPIQVAAPGLMHAKLLILDTKHKTQLAILGSSNHTLGGLGRNLEYNALIESEGPNSPGEFFANLWKIAQPVNPDRYPISESTAATDSPESATDLFDFQRSLVELLETKHGEALAKEPRKKAGGGFLVLPTGSGKTRIALTWIVERKWEHAKPKILWISHRVELLEQAFEQAVQLCHRQRLSWELNPSFRYLTTAAYPGFYTEGNLVFCTNNALTEDRLEEAAKKKWDLIVIDESHRASADTKTYGAILDSLHRRTLLGLTATPYRSSEAGKSGLRFFDRGTTLTAPAKEIDDSLQGRAFSKFEYLHFPTRFAFALNAAGDPEKERTVIREFARQRYVDAVAAAYDQIRKHCSRILVFAISTDHANAIAEAINRRSNADAQPYHNGKMPRSGLPYQLENPGGRMSLFERREIARRFRDGDIRCLVTVLLVTEGFDAPGIDGLIIARPTYSTVLFTQMLGRGMRGPAMGGTETCYVADFVSQTEKHREMHAQMIERFRTGLQVAEALNDPEISG